MFGKNLIFDFVYSATGVKQLLKKFLVIVVSVMIPLLNSIEGGIVVVIFLFEIIVLIPFFSKYF